jgi:uncharacterized protein
MKEEYLAPLKEVEKILRRAKPVMSRRFKVKEIGVFGSYLRGEQKETSDLDLLVEFSEPVGLFDFLRLEAYLAEITGARVDLVSKNALKPRLKERVLAEALYI